MDLTVFNNISGNTQLMMYMGKLLQEAYDIHFVLGLLPRSLYDQTTYEQAKQEYIELTILFQLAAYTPL